MASNYLNIYYYESLHIDIFITTLTQCHNKYQSSKFIDWSNVFIFGFRYFFYFPVGRLTNAARRWYSDVYPKITTHYTVYPRDKDPRWKGE